MATNGQIHVIEDGFAMDTIATEARIAKTDPGYLTSAREVALSGSARAGSVNVETTSTNRLFPAHGQWAIQFSSGGTVTIVLGMRDYGRGWLTAYFADVVSTHLGIPFERIRIYYSANLPAVLHTPRSSRMLVHGSCAGPVARAVAEVIHEMCDQVIENGRVTFAAMVHVDAGDVDFDQLTGRFSVFDRDRSGNILQVVETARA